MKKRRKKKSAIENLVLGRLEGISGEVFAEYSKQITELAGKKPGKDDPQSGGKPVPPATRDIVRQRILAHAEKHYAGTFNRIEVVFRGALCYIDAYQEPGPDSERLAQLCRMSHAGYVEDVRNTAVHLVRLRHFDPDRWSLAFYTYSNERYEPCRYPSGEWFGTVEQAFDVGAVYLTGQLWACLPGPEARAEGSTVVTHRNRRGDTYYLHEGRTKTGKPRYFFSRKQDGTLAESIPAGFETYESPNALVLLRKKVPVLMSDDETRVVTDAVKQNARARKAIVEAKGTAITVFMPSMDPDETADELAADFPFADRAGLRSVLECSIYYSPMMRFVLQGEEKREYQAERWCSMGGIDDWIDIGSPGSLPKLAHQFCRHLGRDSFFELM